MKVRFKAPGGNESRLVSTTLRSEPRPPGANIGFAPARTFSQNDPDGYRSEFIRLADLAGGLAPGSIGEAGNLRAGGASGLLLTAAGALGARIAERANRRVRDGSRSCRVPGHGAVVSGAGSASGAPRLARLRLVHT